MRRMLKKFSAVLLTGIMLVSPITGITVYAQTESDFVTRGQFAAMTSEAFGFSADGAAGFADVATDHPFAVGIAGMQALGFMLGDGAGNFFPDVYISGAEAAVIINNMIGFDGSMVPQVHLPIPAWAVPSASVLLDLDMVDEQLIGRTRLTVDEAAQFVSAAALALVIAPGTPYALSQHRLQDNFFGYINRQFLATGVFNPGWVMATAFGEVAETVRQQQEEILHEILNNPNLPVGSDEWKIRELYNMFLDNEARIASIVLVQPYFDMVREAQSINELLEVARYLSDYFALIPFYSVSFIADSVNDATAWAAIIGERGLTLGSRDLYADIPQLAPVHEAYINMMATMLYHIGETDDLHQRAAAVFDIEQQRAARMMPVEYAASFIGMFTPANWEDMLEASDTTGLLTFNEALFERMVEMNLYSRSLEYVAFINSLYVDENLEVLRDVALISMFSSVMSVLDDAFSGIADELMSVLLGQPINSGDVTIEARGQQLVTSFMWRTFSRAYYQRFSSQELKGYVIEMTEEIRDMMREMIGEIEWMTLETRALSVEKLDAVTAYIAFPDEPVAEWPLDVRPIDEGGNLIYFMTSFARLSNELWLEILDAPANFNFWEHMPTSTVNAFYNPMQNIIVIPAGILQYPFFCLTNTREQNLGGIGAVIAHEFVHAFDPQGSQFDKYGTISDWWLEEDVVNFAARTNQTIEALNTMEFAGVPINGTLIVGEFVTDLGAMEVIMTLVDRTGGDQALAMEQWARIWASRMSPEVAQFIMMTAVHPPAMIRANLVISQLDEFYRVFGVVEGDGMYIPEENRISFWR